VTSQSAITFYSKVAECVPEMPLKIRSVNYETLAQVCLILKVTVGEGNECKVLQQ
jgi:hypothetical protein